MTYSLSKAERLILINQYRILEKLYPSEVEDLKLTREALESGYTIEYPDIEDEVPEEIAREVLDVLDMYRAITFGLRKLPDDDELRKHFSAKFRGFDGNEEGPRYGYAHYLVERRGDWPELKGSGDGCNSHSNTLYRYRPMLRAWEQCASKYEPTREDLVAIFDAK